MTGEISTHTPHARRDAGVFQTAPVYPLFLLTRLMRGVTLKITEKLMMVNISTHTPHARRDTAAEASRYGSNISTHTPHARRD